jgi:hypothetical protein
MNLLMFFREHALPVSSQTNSSADALSAPRHVAPGAIRIGLET